MYINNVTVQHSFNTVTYVSNYKSYYALYYNTIDTAAVFDESRTLRHITYMGIFIFFHLTNFIIHLTRERRVRLKNCIRAIGFLVRYYAMTCTQFQQGYNVRRNGFRGASTRCLASMIHFFILTRQTQVHVIFSRIHIISLDDTTRLQ